MENTVKINYAFFGSSRLSVVVLNELKKFEYLPSLIVTTPDKPQGRKLLMTPNVVKQWAIANSIKCYDAAKLDTKFVDELKNEVADLKIQIFIVASYGKIIPSAVLAVPPKGALNIHPSLLPKYRGPSPLPSAMLADNKNTGVTIMKIDDEMDHGPIIVQKEIEILEWPKYEEFEEMMAIVGTRLLVENISKWIDGRLTAIPQNHSIATYTKKIAKEDAFIDISMLEDPRTDQYLIFRKIQAYHEWPQAYFFADRRGVKIRVKVTEASFDAESSGVKLMIKKVIPEGSKEMSYADFVRGL